jgi:hypothetical protein
MSLVRSYFRNLYYSKYTLQCLVKIYGPPGPYVKDKPLNEIIDFYQEYRVLVSQRLGLRMFYLFWIRNIYSVSVFIVLLPLNTVLRFVYLLIYLLHIFYWLYKLLFYIYSGGLTDLRPDDNDPIFGVWYLVFIYRFTWKRAHLHSYNVMYNILKRLTTGQPKQSVLQLIVKLPFIIGWYILRIITSVPRQIVIDSYSWSQRFDSWSDVTNWQCNLANGVTAVNIVSELGPLTFKRIYCTKATLWNFNPHKTKS